MATLSFDYLVIGGGSGGLSSARRAAAAYGRRVGLIENTGRLGGTCVNYGCVPKKVMWYASDLAHKMNYANCYGFDAVRFTGECDDLRNLPATHFNWNKLKKAREDYVHRLNMIYAKNLQKENVQYIYGTASFESSNLVKVQKLDGDVIHCTAPNILIATGSRTMFPRDIPGWEHGIGSDGFFELEKQPPVVAIVGAGYIAVEFAGMFHCLGSKVHMFVRHSHLLRAFDSMISESVTNVYEAMGIEIHKYAAPFKRIEKLPDGRLRLVLNKSASQKEHRHKHRKEPTAGSQDGMSTSSAVGTVAGSRTGTGIATGSQDGSRNGSLMDKIKGTVEADGEEKAEENAEENNDREDQEEEEMIVDCLIWAIGRKAYTEGLGLEKLGVAMDDRGFVVVDKFQRTNLDGLLALGDVTGNHELTPVAIAAGRKLSDRLFGGMTESRLEYENIPSTVFAHPEIGTVGMTEKQARRQLGSENIRVYESKFVPMFYALSPEKLPTRYKLVCAGENERVVGLHLFGEDSSEILQGFSVAIRMGATKADFDNCVSIHPTSAEELVTMQ